MDSRNSIDKDPSQRGQWSEGDTRIVFLGLWLPRLPPRICLELPVCWLFSKELTTLEPNIRRSSFSALKNFGSTCNMEVVYCLARLSQTFTFTDLASVEPGWLLKELLSRDNVFKITSKGFSALSTLENEPCLPFFFFFFFDLWLEVETTSAVLFSTEVSCSLMFLVNVSLAISLSSPCRWNWSLASQTNKVPMFNDYPFSSHQ